MPRIAALADIHGNLRALEAVLRDLKDRSADLIVNLGDHVSGPLEAAATADVIMAQQWINIRGNHDRQLLGSSEDMGGSDRAAIQQLTPAHLDWLKTLPAEARPLDDVYLCHGTPADDLRYLMDDIVGDRLALADAATIEARLGDVRTRLVLCGHSHVPRWAQLASGVFVVNPGSVGLPAYDVESPLHYAESGTPHARYAIIDWSATATRIEHVAVEYDWSSASADAATAGRLDWACALATGYARRAPIA